MALIKKSGLLLGAMCLCGAVQAHSPYLLPNGFALEKTDHVTVAASFSEHIFVPEIAMKSDDYHVVGPDARAIPITPSSFRDLVMFEVPIAAPGTYRITSGERIGRMSRAAFVDGGWRFLEPGKEPPPGTTAVNMQSITKAEAYVSLGVPSDAALAPTGKGLEYRAITHPDRIRAGQPAQFELLFNGGPLANTDVEVEEGQIGLRENPRLPIITSDVKGRFSLTAPRPGLYFAMTRYRVAGVGGQPARSFTYALTYSVTE